MNLTAEMPVAFTAQSKRYFYCRDVICSFTLHQGYVPLNPFRIFEYFLHDRVERDQVRQGNFNLIRLSDELWVFGEVIADGVLAEIKYARDLGKPIRFFSIGTREEEIAPLNYDIVQFEDELHTGRLSKKQLLRKIMEHEDDSQLRLF